MDASPEEKKAFNRIVEYFDARQYAFLMIDLEDRDELRDIREGIDPNDIFEPNDPTKGLEKELHVTLAPCLDNTVINQLDDIKAICGSISEINDITYSQVDFFEMKDKDYDVLKLNIVSPKLKDLNRRILEKYPSHSEFKDEYKPHATIAYLKKGTAKKYVKVFSKPLPLNPLSFWLSYTDSDGNKLNNKWN